MKTKVIPVNAWIKKSGFSERKVRRLIKEGVIPTEKIPVYILGINASFKLKEKK